MATSEYRPERCGECGDERQREWLVKTIAKGVTVPRGWRVESRSPEFWKTVAAPTRWTTLCACDAP